MIGEPRLTYEELYTMLARVEACLNSRLLHPLSSDAKDLDSLIPGHFLTESPITDLIYPDITDVKVGRLSRFQLLQAIQQQWRRWQYDYLHQLQPSKWKDPVPEIFGMDTIVVLKKENLLPLRWRLSHIVKLYPGPDGMT